ncbi:MAG TPA: CpsD/CapB family tyrosine-protein kinase [Terriglobia bacterium]|nr:CpsD/CapB family tyrosine-protein kinase [Terriglobia bacterium]
MSHIFEALRKSEGSLLDETLAGPETFFEVLERREDLRSVPAEQVEIKPETRLVVWENPRSLWADRFRILRMHLQKLRNAGKLKTLLLTSPSPQDGKSTVALNLATTLVGREKSKILLLEADLRCPSLTSRFGLKPWPGLAECLDSDTDPIRSVRRIDPLGFFLLPAGSPARNPTELLQLDRLTQVIGTLSACFDFILVDCPPTSPVADTLALKSRADASLLVVRAGKTSRESVEESIRLLGKSHVLGIVLNGLVGLEKEYSDYYRKYYRQTDPAPPQEV